PSQGGSHARPCRGLAARDARVPQRQILSAERLSGVLGPVLAGGRGRGAVGDDFGVKRREGQEAAARGALACARSTGRLFTNSPSCIQGGLILTTWPGRARHGHGSDEAYRLRSR